MAVAEQASGKGSLTIIEHKKSNILTDTAGRIGAVWSNTQIGTPFASKDNMSHETVESLRERFKEAMDEAGVKLNGDIVFNVNHSSFFGELKRLFSKDRNMNIFLRSTIGVASLFAYGIPAHLARRDYYNRYSETGTIYHPNIHVGMQQIARALVLDKKEKSLFSSVFLSLPPFRGVREHQASSWLMEHMFKSEAEREKARNILEPMFWLQIASDVGALTGYLNYIHDFKIPGVELPFSVPLGIIPHKLLYTVPAIPTIGALIGHARRRLKPGDEGNPFFNKSHNQSYYAPRALAAAA